MLEIRYVLDGGHDPPRVGFAISRRTGSAVVRNRLRRRLRVVMHRLSEPDRRPSFPAGDYLVRPRPGAADVTFARLLHDAERVLEHLRLREDLP